MCKERKINISQNMKTQLIFKVTMVASSAQKYKKKIICIVKINNEIKFPLKNSFFLCFAIINIAFILLYLEDLFLMTNTTNGKSSQARF